ncbi:hypothetical protein HK104_000504 [Borealophlyctis nickersoniae]|nr:hypothetical protein HK104_000504 [Borealophlyctis nickersoniae]
MPYPQNLETALAVEDIIRREGCIPAHIAVMNGQVKVGREDLECLAKAGVNARKTSRRDLALVVSQGEIGATTVSGTMVVAHRAGIKVFVTGGIGGVHRGGEHSMDVSADLTELGRTPVAVICAGAKSILDIGRTLEFLETQGVPVITYGNDNELPAFYTPRSGFKSVQNLNSPPACAAAIKANWDLQLGSGMVIAVPIPAKDAPESADAIEGAVVSAVMEAEKKSIRGKDITPFLLDHVKRITGGDSLKANIALVKNNARIGSRIAVALQALTNSGTDTPPAQSQSKMHLMYNTDGMKLSSKSKRPFIIGGTVLDITAKWTRETHSTRDQGVKSILGTSFPGKVLQTAGGVGRNIAEACFRTGGAPRFFSAVGADLAAQMLLDEMRQIRMDISDIQQCPGRTTAVYNAFLQHDGNLVAAVADMSVHDDIDGVKVAEAIGRDRPPLVCIDGNLTVQCMQTILDACAVYDVKALFEPTSVPKSTKIFGLTPHARNAIKYMTPDAQEMAEIRRGWLDGSRDEDGLPYMVVTMGPMGVRVLKGPVDDVPIETFEPTKVLKQCVSVSGAGDSFVGALISGLVRQDHSKEWVRADIIPSAMKAAELSLMSTRAVGEKLTPAIFDDLAR